MEVDDLNYRDGVPYVKCSGEYGVGSDGNPSAELLENVIAQWITEHHPVTQIDVDYSEVDYSWGDGPLSSAFFSGARRCQNSPDCKFRK